ncbi:MAG TPA: tetratricopeptide repeat protein [Candidatus Melainabacteria bacterium]|nr:tetratricopeptide repeat protein [Candidatus Melainabacteria bacterium]HMP50820.1 tetratricopeptide repeat protein [Candidatus Melainabacteria bacterium]
MKVPGIFIFTTIFFLPTMAAHTASAAETKIITVEPSRADLSYIEKKLIDRQNLGKALYLLDKIIEKNPNDSYAYFLIGLTYHRKAYRNLMKYKTMPTALKDFKTAITFYDKADRLGFRTAQLYYHRGECLLNTDRVKEGMADLNRSLAINDKRDWVWATRAMAFRRTKELDKAEADLKKAIGLNPKRATNYAKLSELYNNMGQKDKAILACGRTITLSPRWAAPYELRARLYFEKNQIKEAQADLDRVLALDPSNAAALSLRGKINARQGQLEQATIDLNEAREIDNTVFKKSKGKQKIGATEAKQLFAQLEKKCLRLTGAGFNTSASTFFDLGASRFGQGKWQASKKSFQDLDRLLASQEKAGSKAELKLYAAAMNALASLSLGDKREAQKVLDATLATRVKSNSLALKTVRYLAGRSSLASLLSDAKTREDRVRVRFFAGAKLARTGDKIQAKKLFDEALLTGANELDEYMLTVIEMDRLK